MSSILRAGMVGLDTSHCMAFIEVLHDPTNSHHVPGVKVTGVYVGGSDQFSFSRERIKEFSTEIDNQFHIPIYKSIPDLARDVDVLFLTSVDGRQHVEQVNQMAVGKPVYIDKPFAVTTADAVAIIETAAATNTPIMSCSALRFAEGITELTQVRDDILACEAYGPAPILPDYPGYFWYGIHSAEMLFLLMGGGCQSVRTLTSEKMDLIRGDWRDGRCGLVHGTRFDVYEFGCLVHTRSGARLSIARNTPPYHACLTREIVRFFQSGQSPINLRETYEIIAFLEAADQSKAENGVSVPVLPAPSWM